VQKLTAEVIKQLNNLGGGFPPAPTGPNNEPQNDEQWILGDWLEEIRVRPGVPAVIDLPLLDNEIGDVRFVVALGTWYWWDGAVWAPAGGGGGGVTTVTASAPLASSGGANPDISFPSWPANASGALTNNGAGALSWVPAGSGTVVDVPATAQEALNAGDLVRFVNDAGTPRVQKADATNTDARLNGVGFAVAAASAGAAVSVRVVGVADVPAARFDAAPGVANVGQRVFVSTTSGQVTLTAPSVGGNIVQRAGILVDGGANPKVLVQIGDPVLL
jgi:hypothetical protein